MTVARSRALQALAAVTLGGAVTLGTTAALGWNPAGADTTLGGFTVAAVAEASTVQYEQPNLPIPATPSIELDEGYAATTDNFGPTGSATAATLYPGQVVANSGPELGAFAPGVPLPPAPVWPIEAVSTYPQTPSASTDKPGVTMESSSTADGNTATATIGSAGTPAAGSAPAAAPAGTGGLGSLLPSVAGGSAAGSTAAPSPAASSGLGTVQDVSGTSSSTAVGQAATAAATATDSGIALLGGVLSIASVSSTASASSNGTAATLTGSTTVTGATVNGQAVTIDASGVHAANASSPSAAAATAAAQSILNTLGITLTVTNPTDSVNGPQGSRQLDGLRIQVNLDTLDQQADKLSALIPPAVLAHLPVRVPNKQVLVWDLGTVDVQSTAEPAFDVPDTDSGSGSGAQSALSTAGVAGALGVDGATRDTTPGYTPDT